MPTYVVTITVADSDETTTRTVTAADEWKARSRAMGEWLTSANPPALHGAHVSYVVTEVAP